VVHNGAEIGAVLDNAGINSINRVMIAPDSAVDTVGSLRVDNVVIDGGISAVDPSSKATLKWCEIKASL
jgi:hypothetical protein